MDMEQIFSRMCMRARVDTKSKSSYSEAIEWDFFRSLMRSDLSTQEV